MKTPLRRIRSACTAALVVALLAPALAWAHQRLVSSDPGDGARLDVAPAELRLVFYEPVQERFTRVELLGPDGARVALGELRIPADSSNVAALRVAGRLTAGAHTVRWRSAGLDGHPVQGSYAFVIEEGAAGLPIEEPDDPDEEAEPAVHHDPAIFPADREFDAASPLYVAIRGLLFAGLLSVIGAVAFRLLVLAGLRRNRSPYHAALAEPASRGAAGIGLIAAAVLLVAVIGRLYAQSRALHGPGDALDPGLLRLMVAGTLWGTGWLIQAAAAVAALAGFALARGGRVAGWALASVSVLALGFTPALSGHAVATPDHAALAVLSDGVHVLAAGGWLGGLLMVIAAGLPAAVRLGEGRRAPAVAALVNAFSPTALVFGGAVVATGVFAAWLHVGDVGALWQTAYGRTLLLKVGVLSVLFLTGAYNYLRVRPALGTDAATRRLRRSSSFELAVAIVVILVTAVLVAMPTPYDVAAPDAHGSAPCQSAETTTSTACQQYQATALRHGR